MNIEKAIEILEHPPFYPSTPSDEEYADSINLGIEALKRIKAIRPYSNSGHSYYLLGETKE